MGACLRRFPEYDLDLGVLSGHVTKVGMIEFLKGIDKNKDALIIFLKNVELSEISVALIPAMRKAVTPSKSERPGEIKSTAFVSFRKSNQIFLRFWIHYAAAGIVGARKREIFATVEAACQWLALPSDAHHRLSAAANEMAASAGEKVS